MPATNKPDKEPDKTDSRPKRTSTQKIGYLASVCLFNRNEKRDLEKAIQESLKDVKSLPLAPAPAPAASSAATAKTPQPEPPPAAKSNDTPKNQANGTSLSNKETGTAGDGAVSDNPSSVAGSEDGRPKRNAARRAAHTLQYANISALMQEEADIRRAIQASILELKRSKMRAAMENGHASDTVLLPPGKGRTPKGSGCSTTSSVADRNCVFEGAVRKTIPPQRKFAQNSYERYHYVSTTPVKPPTPAKPTVEVFPLIKPTAVEFLSFVSLRNLPGGVPPELDLEARNKQAALQLKEKKTPTSARKPPEGPSTSAVRKQPDASGVTRKLALSSQDSPIAKKRSEKPTSGSPAKKLKLADNSKFTSLANNKSPTKANAFANSKKIVEKAKKFTPMAANKIAAKKQSSPEHLPRAATSSTPAAPKPAAKKHKVTMPAKRVTRSISSASSGKSQEDIERERLKIKQRILEIERQHALERRRSATTARKTARSSSSSSSSSDSSSDSDADINISRKVTTTKVAAKVTTKVTTKVATKVATKVTTTKPPPAPKVQPKTVVVNKSKSPPKSPKSPTRRPSLSPTRRSPIRRLATPDTGGRALRHSTKTITLATKNLTVTRVTNSRATRRMTH